MSITREEAYLNAIAESGGADLTPATREELFLAYIAGQDVTLPTPITRKEQLLLKVAESIGNSGGGSGGGDSGGASGIYMAKITLAEYSNYLTINHNLGTTDILYVAAWLENKGDYAFEANGMLLCKMWAKTDFTTQRGGNGFCTGYSWNLNNSYASPNAPNGKGYETLTVVDGNTVKLPAVASGSDGGYWAGLTFTVFVIAANMGV